MVCRTDQTRAIRRSTQSLFAAATCEPRTTAMSSAAELDEALEEAIARVMACALRHGIGVMVTSISARQLHSARPPRSPVRTDPPAA